MKKPMIKALAFATAITMVFSTPLTAMADGLASLYAEGSGEGSGSGSGTGTKENHDIIGDNPGEETIAKIVGVVLDKDRLTVTAGEQYDDDVLTASLIMERDTNDVAGRVQTITVNASNIDQYGDVMVMVNGKVMETNEVLQKCIVWDEVGGKDLVELVKTKANDNRQIQVKGKAMGVTQVRVGIAGTKCYDTATVTVKKYATGKLTFKPLGKMYVKHTVNMNDYLNVPAGTNDTYTWKVYEVGKPGKSTSYASISQDGILTLKKVTKGKQIEVIATGEKGATGSTGGFEIEAGTPIKKLTKSKEVKELTITSSVRYPQADLEVTPDPADTTDFITWKTSNASVVTVAPKNPLGAGQSTTASILGMNPGKATITATATSGKKVTFKVTVKAPLDKITGITADRQTIYAGQKVQLTAVTVPGVWDEAKKIKFKLDPSSDKKVATVNSKVVLQSNTNNIEGSVKVIAYYKNIQSPAIEFKINKSTVTGVSVKVKEGYSTTLKMVKDSQKQSTILEGTAVGGTPDMLTWSSSKPKVATVDQDGKVTAWSSGTTKITASALGADNKMKKDSITITVKQVVTQIDLNKANVTVNYKDNGKDYKVSLKVSKQYPKGAKKEKVSWVIASVNGSIVDKNVDPATNISVERSTGKLILPSDTPNGTVVKVRAFCENGATATATVTVCNQTKKVTVDNKKPEITVGDTSPYVLDKHVTVEPKSGDAKYNEKILSYTANNSNVKIMRTKDGYAVYGIKAGKAVVTAKTASGKSVKITFTVKES